MPKKAFAACVFFLLILGISWAGPCTLRIIGWEGYMDQSFVKPFEQKTGCLVTATYAGSSDEMFAKIMAGGGSTYDLVTASGDLTERLYDAGLLQPINLKKISNYSQLFRPFVKPQYNTFEGIPYGVSIAWGPDLLIYDQSVVRRKPDSWNILYGKHYASEVALPDYPIFIADVALWQGDKDIYHISKNQLDGKIKDGLMALRPQVRKFWSSQGELTQLFLDKEIALAWGWPVTVQKLEQEGFPVGAVIPKEGTTGWSDSWMIIKGSPNTAAAHAWINYMLEGGPQKKMALVTGYWPVSKKIIPFLSPRERKEWHVTDINSFYKEIRFWRTVRNYDQWTSLWDEFRGQ